MFSPSLRSIKRFSCDLRKDNSQSKSPSRGRQANCPKTFIIDATQVTSISYPKFIHPLYCCTRFDHPNISITFPINIGFFLTSYIEFFLFLFYFYFFIIKKKTTSRLHMTSNLFITISNIKFIYHHL